MREILITILILGCFSTFTSAERGLFEFHDSYGRCWRCFPGSACVRCPGSHNPFEDVLCGVPTCTTENEGVTFPHIDIRFYWMCTTIGPVEVNCFCDRIYQHSTRSCIYSDELVSLSCNADDYICMDNVWVCGTLPAPLPGDCLNETTTTSTTTVSSIPTAPNESTESTTVTKTTPSVPTAPNESTESTTTTVTGSTTISVPTAPNDTTTKVTGSTTTTIWVPTAPNDTTSTTTETTTTTSNGITDPNTTPTRTTEMGLPEGWTPPYFTVPPTGTTKPPIWVPTAPNESTTTTNDNGITDPITTPTRTTEVGGPDGIPPVNTDTTTIPSDAGTTPAPCVCVVWWPCWCNPCWNMPCHSCNGCYGMMG